jgi:hypothetical protein
MAIHYAAFRRDSLETDRVTDPAMMRFAGNEVAADRLAYVALLLFKHITALL